MTSAYRGTAGYLGAMAAGAVLLLGACADGAGFPSLARRAAETAGVEPNPAASAPATDLPADPAAATTAALGPLRETAAGAHARFATKAPAAERAAAAAGPLGSETWAAASVALAALEEAHDQQTTALAQIDQLQADRQIADAGTDSADTAAILATRDAVADAAAADGAVIDRLRARLAR